MGKEKRYMVVMRTNKHIWYHKTNSLRLAKWIADLRFWKHAKIHDKFASDVDAPWSKCIYVNDKRGL